MFSFLMLGAWLGVVASMTCCLCLALLGLRFESSNFLWTVAVVGAIIGALVGAIINLFTRLKKANKEHEQLISFVKEFTSFNHLQEAIDATLQTAAWACSLASQRVIGYQQKQFYLMGISQVEQLQLGYKTDVAIFREVENEFYYKYELAKHFKGVLGFSLLQMEWQEYVPKPTSPADGSADRADTSPREQGQYE